MYQQTPRITFIAVIVLLLSLVVVLYFQVSKNQSGSKANPVPDASNVSAIDGDFDWFSKVLSKSTRPQLFELLQSTRAQHTDDLPVRFESSQNQIAIAERILQVSVGKVHVDEATTLLINKLREFLQIHFAQDSELNDEFRNRLSLLTDTVSDSSDLETRKAAAVARAFLASVDCAELQPNATVDDPSVKVLDQHMKMAASLDLSLIHI